MLRFGSISFILQDILGMDRKFEWIPTRKSDDDPKQARRTERSMRLLFLSEKQEQ